MTVTTTTARTAQLTHNHDVLLPCYSRCRAFPGVRPAATIEQPAAPLAAQPAGPAQLAAATVTDLHNDPIVEVTANGRAYRLRIDLARTFERTTRPIVEAVLIEAGRQLRRNAGLAPAGQWTRDKATGAWTAPLTDIPGRCLTCIHGCACTVSSVGCEHFGCLFVQDHTIRNTCDGVEVLRQPRRPRPPARAARH